VASFFQQIFTLERDCVSACDLLGMGSEFARVKRAEHTRVLFLLGKGMVSRMGHYFAS
jgi:MAternally-affected-uncoordination protein